MQRRRAQKKSQAKKRVRRTQKSPRSSAAPASLGHRRSATEAQIAALRARLEAAAASYTPEPSVADEHIADAVAPMFRALQKHGDPNARGHEFEKLLQRLFRIAGFDAERNPSIAHPRQTDLLA